MSTFWIFTVNNALILKAIDSLGEFDGASVSY